MAKENKNLIIIIGTLAVLGILAYAGVFGKLGAISSGAETLSFSKVSTDANGDILLTVVPNGGGQSFTGTLTSDQASSLSGGAVSLSAPVQIKVELTKQDCAYNIKETNDILYSVDAGSGCNPNQCQPPSGSDYTYCYGYQTCQAYPNSGHNDAYKYDYSKKTPQDHIAKLDSTLNFDWSATTKVSQGGVEIASATLSPMVSVADLGTIGQVRLAGGLIGNQFCPTPQMDTSFIRTLTSNTYIAKDLFAINIYKGMLASYLANPSVASGQALQAQYQAIINSGANPSSACNIVAQADGSLRYSCTPISAVYLPEIVIRLKSSAIGQIAVHQATGIPSITSVSSPVLTEAGNTQMNVVVKNTGTETDTFDVALNCPTQVSFTSTRVSVNAGESGTATILVNGMAGIQQCTVSAFSVGDPSIKDEQSISLTIELKDCPFNCCTGVNYKNKVCPASVKVPSCDTVNTTNCQITEYALTCVKTECERTNILSVTATTSDKIDTTVSPQTVSTPAGDKVEYIAGAGAKAQQPSVGTTDTSLYLVGGVLGVVLVAYVVANSRKK